MHTKTCLLSYLYNNNIVVCEFVFTQSHACMSLMPAT